MNTAAVARPELISELSGEFGAQAVVLAIDAKRAGDHWDVMVRGGRDSANRDALAWAQQGVELGAGEILLTSVDRDGTQLGFDTPLTAADFARRLRSRDRLRWRKTSANISRRSFPKERLTPLSLPPYFTTTCNPSAQLKEFLAARNIEVRLPC